MAWDYDAEVTADAPYLVWRLDEAAGTTATDDAGAQDGTYAGTAGEYVVNQTSIVWDKGKCCSFNLDGAAADDGRVELNPVAGFPADAITVEFWIENPTSITNAFAFSYAQGAELREFSIMFVSAASIRLYCQGATLNFTLISPANNLSDGRAHHIAVTWSKAAGEAKCYVDGLYHASGTVSAGTSIADGGCLMLAQDQSVVGTIGAAGNAFEGRLDEFAIYPTVLTEARIRVHASAGLTRYAAYNTITLAEPELFEISAPGQSYVNRVYDTAKSGGAGFVRWTTVAEADPTGVSYPAGNGTFGVDTSDYCVEQVYTA